MNVYVTGANGRLGQEFMKLIPDAIPIVRKKHGMKKEVVTDFSASELKKILKNADVVVHLAASLDFENKKALLEGNVELTKKIVAATPAKAKIVYASSISVYGKKLARIPATEKTSVHPDSEYAKTKYIAEKEVLKHKNSLALRIAAIYGPKLKDYLKMIRILHKGRMLLIGEGNNHVPFVHIEDVAKALEAAIKAKPGIYLICANAMTQNEIFELVSKELKIAPPKHKISYTLASFLLWATRFLRKLFKQGDFLTLEHLSILAHDRMFDCSKARRELNFRPGKTEDGIREMVRIYLRGKN